MNVYGVPVTTDIFNSGYSYNGGSLLHHFGPILEQHLSRGNLIKLAAIMFSCLSTYECQVMGCTRLVRNIAPLPQWILREDDEALFDMYKERHMQLMNQTSKGILYPILCVVVRSSRIVRLSSVLKFENCTAQFASVVYVLYCEYPLSNSRCSC